MPRFLWSELRMRPAQIIVVVLFMAVYSSITLYLVGPQSDCLSVRDFTAQLQRYKLRADASGLLESLTADGDNSVDTVSVRKAKLFDDEADERGLSRRRDVRSKVKDLDVAETDQSSVKPKTKSNDKRQYFVGDSLPIDDLLNSNHIPNVVYFAWCGRRWFEFHNYLAVRSVIRHLRPDNIVFLFDVPPIVDDWTYNTWYKELTDDYPFFHPYQLNPSTEPACQGHAKPNMTFMLSLLRASGGTYINEHTILAEYPVEFRLLDLVLATDPLATGDNRTPALLCVKSGAAGIAVGSNNGLELRPADDQSLRRRRHFDCATIEGYVSANRKSSCVSVNDERRLFPRDIWERADSFGRLARTIFYGTPSVLRPVPSYDELIPNIAHIVWLGRGEMDFLFYLCVASLIHVAGVDAVYIHGDGAPGGGYWSHVKDHPKVHLIYREYQRTIYGTAVNVVSHVTDVWRVDFMVKYGGIYVDTDTVFVRPLDREIRGYDAVGSYDWTYWNHPFPDTINFGVALGKRNAPYWHKFQESMKWFKDDDWSWNGLRQPYRIQERHPDLVRIDPRLQVICYESKCHPTWWPDYHNESVHHLNSKSITNWRKDVYAFHWTLPTPFELKQPANLLATNTIFSEIGKFILEKAGTLEYFRKLVEKETNSNS